MGYRLPDSEARTRELREELERILPGIVALGALKVLLIGSLAKGGVRSDSDIDLLVVRETDKRFLDRVQEVYEAVRPRKAVDILVYTPRELEELYPVSSFLREALKKAEVLYEQDSP